MMNWVNIAQQIQITPVAPLERKEQRPKSY